MDDRYKQILGLDEYKPVEDYVCFMPWCGEFGWYIMNHVKRVHAYNHSNKIVCIKKGHECLFPTASSFYYGWEDISDDLKTGVVDYNDTNAIKSEIIKKFGSVHFCNPSDTSWEEKQSLASIHFKPQPLFSFGIDIDVALTPRKRNIDIIRNWTKENWQKVVDGLEAKGYKVGICGSKESSFDLDVQCKSWNFIDVDTDVEMLTKAKMVVSQESGLAYLAMLCESPLLIIDRCHNQIADKHRREDIYFKSNNLCFGNPDLVIKEVLGYLSE